MPDSTTPAPTPPLDFDADAILAAAVRDDDLDDAIPFEDL
jgi:hypothetical protein